MRPIIYAGDESDRGLGMSRMIRFAIMAVAMAVFANCALASSQFYIAASGADSNSGTSKSSPWQHAPGMANCAASCASYSPQAGDQFIFKGGDTWGSASFVWNWKWSGTAGSMIYIGVDESWFSSGTWTRPVMDCQGSCDQQLNASSSFSNVQIDNLEWKGLANSSSAPSFGSIYSINMHMLGSNPNVWVSNNYFHGWNVLHDNSQDAILVIWSTGATDSNSRVYNNVADGSDSTGNAPKVMCFLYGSPGQIYNNYVGHMSNGYVNGSNSSGGGAWVRSFHDNLVEYIGQSVDGATHEKYV